MVTNSNDLTELRHLLHRVMRGIWARRRPTPELLALVDGDPPLGRRHVGLLAHIGAEGEKTVSELAGELGLSLPATSKLTGELEDHGLVRRREDADDRRRTLVGLSPDTAAHVQAWIGRRHEALERTLASLDDTERAAFLKGLRTLGDALMEESPHGPLGRHHRTAHRRRQHRDRPV